ncbi:MAG: hypothetical protein IT443_07915 [Phycisphaeraceae bacterium]|nr:hypothetical protein [Phycisphaeraceae bacterium]
MTGGVRKGMPGGPGFAGGARVPGIPGGELLAGLRYPVVIRVPKVYLILLGFIWVVLIALGFWSGRSIGFKHGLTVGQERLEALLPPTMTNLGEGQDNSSGNTGGLEQQAKQSQARNSWALGEGAGDQPAKRGTSQANPLPGVSPAAISSQATSGGGTSGGTSGGVSGGISVGGGKDPRVVGLNYIVMANCSEEEARRMVDFLARQGVDAAGIKPHNSSLFQVVALRGFTADELGTKARVYRQQLLALGPAWKREGGVDFQKSGIYAAKYQGEKINAVIYRGRQP